MRGGVYPADCGTERHESYRSFSDSEPGIGDICAGRNDTLVPEAQQPGNIRLCPDVSCDYSGTASRNKKEEWHNRTYGVKK